MLTLSNWKKIDFVGVDSIQGCLIFWFEVQFGKWPILSGYLWKDGESWLRIAYITIYTWIFPLAPSKLDKNWLQGMRFGVAKYQWVLIMVVVGSGGEVCGVWH
jgi:hypothetical protein